MNESHENVLPPAVQKQVDEANAIIAQMNADAPEPPKQESKPNPPEPAPEPPKQESKPNPPPEPPKQDWKHKYSVLQGKYDAEVPRLNEDLREARSGLRKMQDKVSHLETLVASMQAVQTRPAEPDKPLITQEEIDTFGPDLIDIVGRVAKQVLEPYVDKRFGEIEKNVKQVGENVASTQKTMAESARDRLYERLDKTVPEWRTINRTQEFVNWLNEVDPYTGVPKGVNLRAAFERNDSDRVLAFFEGFQKEHAVATEDPDPAAPTEESAPPHEGPQQGLETLVAPGTPKTGTTVAQEESGKGRIWTRQMISDFYNQKNELIKADPNRDLPDKIQALERDLFKAQSEGRIRN